MSAGTTGVTNPASTAREDSSIGRRAASGAVWVFLAVAASKVLGVGTYFVLARLLNPDDFGLVRFALILIGAFTILQDLGVPASIIHSDRDIKATGGTALTINVAASALLFGAAVLLSPSMATLAGDDAVGPVLIVLAIGLVVLALGSVQRAMLDRELAFRRRFVPDVVPLVASGIVSIALAFLGFGAWSLVWGYLVKAIMSSSLLWSMSPIRPRPDFQPAIARELFRYGKHMSLVSIVGFVAINADYFIVGQMLGTYDLGLYTLAFLISNLPFQAVVEPVHRVMFPAYCRVRGNTDAVVALYGNAITIVSILVVPACLCIFIAGPVYTTIIFGEQWNGIGSPLKLLAVFTAMTSIYRSFASVFSAIGRPDLVWRLNVVRLGILIPVMVLLAGQYGLVGIASAYVLVSAVFIPLNAYRLSSLLNVSTRRFFRLLTPQLTGAAVAGLIIMIWNTVPLLVPMNSNPIGVIVLAALSIVAYGVTVVLINPDVITLGQGNPIVDIARRRLSVQ